MYRQEKKSLKRKLGACEKGNEDWSKCLFWITKKNRYCSMERYKLSKFCSHHCSQEELDVNDSRVPCPIDPSHSVSSLKLNKHIKICQRQSEITAISKFPYFQEDVNVDEDIVGECNIEMKEIVIS